MVEENILSKFWEKNNGSFGIVKKNNGWESIIFFAQLLDIRNWIDVGLWRRSSHI